MNSIHWMQIQRFSAHNKTTPSPGSPTYRRLPPIPNGISAAPYRAKPVSPGPPCDSSALRWFNRYLLLPRTGGIPVALPYAATPASFHKVQYPKHWVFSTSFQTTEQ